MAILRDWDLKIGIDDVLRGQGMDPQQIRARRPALIKTAEWALQEGLPLLDPAVLVEEFALSGVRHELVLLEGGGKLRSPLLVQHLAGAARLAVIICSIGPQLEAVSGDLFQEEPLLALALEGFGTAATEALATEACNRLEVAAQVEGLFPSIPLSPGMVGWPVDPGQAQLFGLVDATQIGVHLNSSAMMQPRMSLSQVLGFAVSPSFQGRTCDYCNLKETCRYQEHYV